MKNATEFKKDDMVEFDASGKGDMEIGKVIDTTDRKLTIATATDTVKIYKKHCTKVTLKQAKQAMKNLTVDGDDEEESAGHLLIFRHLETYVRGLSTTASGRDTYDNNDDIANTLRVAASDLKAQYRMAAFFLASVDVFNPEKEVFPSKARITAIAEELAVKYEGLNPGMQRMNLGNRIRGAIKRMDLNKKQMKAYLNAA